MNDSTIVWNNCAFFVYNGYNEKVLNVTKKHYNKVTKSILTLNRIRVMMVSEINMTLKQRRITMKETIRLKIDDEFETEFDKLYSLLKLLKIDCRMEFKENKSMSGAKFTDEYLVIECDRQEIFKKLYRSAGRKKTRMNCIALTVEEARKRIEEETAEEVAKSLGISRRTLFRRLAEAEKNGDKYIY